MNTASSTVPATAWADTATKRRSRRTWIVGAVLVAGLGVAPAPAFAVPQEDSDIRYFSDFILDSLCKEGRPDHVNQSCTMPDGSVWTCVPTYGGQNMCTREGAAGPTGPTIATPPAPDQQAPDF